jgi:hypothetical protein
MSITHTSISANHNEVHLGQTALLVFSYQTLVAVEVFGPNHAKYRTSEYHSITTSKHINASGFRGALEVSPERLAALALTNTEGN